MNSPRPIRKIIFLFGGGLFLLLALIWASQRSLLEINIPNASGNASYVLTDDEGNSSTGEIKNGQFNKLIGSGHYEITVTQGDKNYYEAVRPVGFFRKTTVTAQLTAEQNRSFIGDNPGSCMELVESLLISHACGGPYQSMTTHIAATATSPTVTKTDRSIAGDIEGTVRTGEGTLLLVQNPAVGSTQAHHALYKLSANGSSPVRSTLVAQLPRLVPQNLYKIANYRDGFIIYDPARLTVFYYASSAKASDPAKIELEGPQNSELGANSLTTSGDAIVALYQNPTSEENATRESEVVINADGSARHFTFSENLLSARLCGTRLCLQNTSKRLLVYNIDSGKASLDFALSEVESLAEAGENLFVANQQGVLRLNPESRQGSFIYQIGVYKINSIQPTSSGLLVAVTGPQSKKSALLISTSGLDNTIDKKIADLLGQPFIKTVSAYGKFIFISPDLGEPVFVPETNSFDYGQTIRNDVSKKLDQVLKDIQVDTSKYTVYRSLLQ